MVHRIKIDRCLLVKGEQIRISKVATVIYLNVLFELLPIEAEEAQEKVRIYYNFV
jgi:hypothetical protein